MKLAGGTNDFLTVPTNAAFNQTVEGSIDSWVKLSAAGVPQTICSKGKALATHNYSFYVNTSNKFVINIGSHNYMGQTSIRLNRTDLLMLKR